MANIIDSSEPLSRTHLPAQFVNRETEQETLSQAFGTGTDPRLQHLHVYGLRGSGKTHLLQHFLTMFPSTVSTCYVSGLSHNTQYKVLEQLLQQLTGERVGTGYHVADLQRRLTEAMTLSTVIVLDEVEFLLLNDGNDLIYFLSRLDDTAVITVSSTYRSLSDYLDARTFSSFQPQVLTFDPYTVDETIEILADRARQALQPQSLHRAALVRIASTTQNIGIGLAWLRVAAESADDVVTADLVDTLQPAGYEAYVDALLGEFTPHHRRLYKTIDRLERFQAEESPFVTGTVYEAYNDHCETAGVAPLSERRVSDFLTHLELLDLIEATYHHGGAKGKTREISLVDWTITPAST